MVEPLIPFELCLKSGEGDDVSVQIDPGETFEQFISKTQAAFGYVVDINSITNGDPIDLQDNMYDYLLRVEKQLSNLKEETVEETEPVESSEGTIYVFEDGTPIDPSMITFENGVAILKTQPDEIYQRADNKKQTFNEVEYIDGDLQIDLKDDRNEAKQDAEIEIAEVEVSTEEKPPPKNVINYKSDDGEVETLDEALLLEFEKTMYGKGRNKAKYKGSRGKRERLEVHREPESKVVSIPEEPHIPPDPELEIDELHIRSAEDEDAIVPTEEGNVKKDPNLKYKLVPSRNADFAAQFSEFIGENRRAESPEMLRNGKGKGMLRQMRFPSVEEEPPPRRTFKVKETAEPSSNSSLVPKITQFKIVAPYSLKSRYGSPPPSPPRKKSPEKAVLVPRWPQPPEVPARPPSAELPDSSEEDEYYKEFDRQLSEDELSDLDFCQFCVRLFKTRAEKAFLIKGNKTDIVKPSISKVLCNGCLSRGYAQTSKSIRALSADEIFVLKNKEFFIYKPKSAMVKKRVDHTTVKTVRVEAKITPKNSPFKKEVHLKKVHNCSDDSDCENRKSRKEDVLRFDGVVDLTSVVSVPQISKSELISSQGWNPLSMRSSQNGSSSPSKFKKKKMLVEEDGTVHQFKIVDISKITGTPTAKAEVKTKEPSFKGLPQRRAGRLMTFGADPSVRVIRAGEAQIGVNDLKRVKKINQRYEEYYTEHHNRSAARLAPKEAKFLIGKTTVTRMMMSPDGLMPVKRSTTPAKPPPKKRGRKPKVVIQSVTNPDWKKHTVVHDIPPIPPPIGDALSESTPSDDAPLEDPPPQDTSHENTLLEDTPPQNTPPLDPPAASVRDPTAKPLPEQKPMITNPTIVEAVTAKPVEQSPLEYSCRLCNKRMQYITLVVSHSIRHQNITEREFPCIICPTSFHDYRSVSLHMKREHPIPGYSQEANIEKPEGKPLPSAGQKLATLTNSPPKIDTVKREMKSAEKMQTGSEEDDEVTKAMKIVFGETDSTPSVIAAPSKPTATVKPTTIEKTTLSAVQKHTPIRATPMKKVESPPQKAPGILPEKITAETKKLPESTISMGSPTSAEKELVQALLSAYDVVDLDLEILNQLKGSLLKTIRMGAKQSKLSPETETNMQLEEHFNCHLCRETFKSASELKLHSCEPTNKGPAALQHSIVEKQVSKSSANPIRQCPKCGETRSTMSRLKFHLRFHEPPYLYQRPITYDCRLCSALFKNEEILFRHMELIHFPDLRKQMKREKPLNALVGFGQQSSTVFFSRRARKARSKTLLPSTCHVCFKKVPRKVLRSHLDEHKLEYKTGSVYYCLICYQCFDDLHLAENHTYISKQCWVNQDKYLKNVDDDIENDVPPNLIQLQKLYKMITDKSRKIIRVKTIRVVYKCEYCDASSLNKTSLRNHWKSHEGGKTPFACLSCSQTFTTHGRLISHRMADCWKSIHKPLNKDPSEKIGIDKNVPLDSGFPVVRLFLCPHCEQTFLHWAYMKAHQRICHCRHTHKCGLCSKEFKSIWSVKHHKEADHSEAYFNCDKCDFWTLSKKGLIDHKKSTHGGSFPCPICGMRFSTMRWMEFHKKSHGKQIKYQCPKCPLTFINTTPLRNHIVNDHKERVVFSCPKCPKKFDMEKEVAAHLQTDHPVIIKPTYLLNQQTKDSALNRIMSSVTTNRGTPTNISKTSTTQDVTDLMDILGNNSAARIVARKPPVKRKVSESQSTRINLPAQKQSGPSPRLNTNEDLFVSGYVKRNAVFRERILDETGMMEYGSRSSTKGSKYVPPSNAYIIENLSPSTTEAALPMAKPRTKKEIAANTPYHMKMSMSDGGKTLNKPLKQNSRGVFNVFDKSASMRNTARTQSGTSVTPWAKRYSGNVAISGDAGTANTSKSMDIGEVINMLENSSTAAIKSCDRLQVSLSSSLPIVINESGTLNVVLDESGLQTLSDDSAVNSAAVPPALIEQESSIENAANTLQYAEGDGELLTMEQGETVQLQEGDVVYDDNVIVVDEEGRPIPNGKVEEMSNEIMLTTDGHLIANGQVFKLNVREGATLDLEKITIRQGEDGQIILETLEDETSLEGITGPL